VYVSSDRNFRSAACFVSMKLVTYVANMESGKSHDDGGVGAALFRFS